MTDYQNIPQQALGDHAARQLANATKTVPQLSTISPRWLAQHAAMAAGGGGYFPPQPGEKRLERARAISQRDEAELPQTYVDYEQNPREYFLNAVTTVLDVHTRVSDLTCSSPHDQIREQLRPTIETIKEPGKRTDQQPGIRPAEQ